MLLNFLFPLLFIEILLLALCHMFLDCCSRFYCLSDVDVNLFTAIAYQLAFTLELSVNLDNVSFY